MKVLKEWTINAPWGKIAMVSWGCETGGGVLLVHGREDSAATFVPLLRLLPATRHYVALDLPGHGLSDPLPKGVMVSRLHFVGAVQAALEHLKWTSFIFIGHSMGCEAGLFFNAVYPRRVSKLVLLDPAVGLARLQVPDPVEYFASFHQHYYDNYHKYNNGPKRLYSKRRALESVMAARGFDAAQAELALQRCLVPAGGGNDLYELSWDRRLKMLWPPNYPVSYYFELFSRHSPPTLLISARDSLTKGVGYTKGNAAALELIHKLQKNLDNFTVLTVEGGHDVHFTNPERFAKVLCEFLDKDDFKSKL